MTRTQAACAVALALLLALPGRARAEGALDVASELRGIELGRRIGLFEDKSAALTIEQVSAPSFARRFGTSAQAAPAFDYADSAFWMRVVVKNSARVERAWLLELAYPLLDYVTLYVPRSEGGFDTRDSGDMRPFSQRDLEYRAAVFMLEEPPGSERTYYLRVATSGTITLPLVAWTMKEFIEHQHLDWAGLCVFYGVILVMFCYSTCLFLFTRDREHLFLGLFVLSIGLVQFTFVGHTFQFLLPNDMVLAGRILPVSIALSFYCACQFSRERVTRHGSQTYRYFYRLAMLYALALACMSLVVPYGFSIKLVTRTIILLNTIGLVLHLHNLWHDEERLMIAGWVTAIIGFAAAFLRLTGVLPTNALTVWSFQLGATVQFILFASSLASRLNVTRAEVDVRNGELVQRVVSLEEAVLRAKIATERATQAVRVKDAFMATMSHELRTPLNAIINLPQGLLDDFPLSRYAVCARCEATFELETYEHLTERTPCPDCRETALTPKDVVRYVGRPGRTARYLEMIEHAGNHLLEVVNGILEVGNIKSGQITLALANIDVGELLRTAVGELEASAQRAGVDITLPKALVAAQVSADPQRLRQVLISLLSNAIKFSQGRGSVVVDAVVRADGWLFSVKDEGIGIARESFETIFSFEQTHLPERRKFGASGPSLAVSRALVRAHGGNLWVESELGRGATFLFLIPHAEQHAQGLAPALVAAG
jgi:signal transduction histidine kinase